MLMDRGKKSIELDRVGPLSGCFLQSLNRGSYWGKWLDSQWWSTSPGREI